MYKHNKKKSSTQQYHIDNSGNELNVNFTLNKSLKEKDSIFSTIPVSQKMFFDILYYSTCNPICEWSEFGFDKKNKWVTINDCKFEDLISIQEKKPLLEYLNNQDLTNILFNYIDNDTNIKNQLKKETFTEDFIPFATNFHDLLIKYLNKRFPATLNYKNFNILFINENLFEIEHMYNTHLKSKLEHFLNDDPVSQMFLHFIKNEFECSKED